MKNVLIFPSATYPAMQIIDCLKNNPRFQIIAGASYPNHSEYICENSVVDMPLLNSPNFMDYFIEFIRDNDIRFVIPTDETAAMYLKEHENDIPAVIVCSPFETARLCRYKSLTYSALAGEAYVPNTYETSAIEGIQNYPVFIKPDNSQGSKGARVVNSLAELRQIDNLQNYVICEYLPGEEYTVDCFTSKKGELLFCNPRVRTRLMNGITARGHNINFTPEFQEIIDSLNSRIKFRGYWFAQLKRDVDGKLKLLEICTRFAGSFAISKGKGVNLPLLALYDFADLDTEVIQNDYVVECDKTYIDRYKLGLSYQHVYVDYDDTITFKGGIAVNPYIIAYLYQCKSREIKISLITRHDDTFNERIEDSFKRLSISKGLFDEILELKWNEKKSNYIIDRSNSIFIDNSFKERKEVHDRCGIPVFDVSNIDSLFDWRD